MASQEPFKFALMGASKCGITALRNRFCEKTFKLSPEGPGIDFTRAEVLVNGTQHSVMVWQPSRAESFMGLNRGYARMARASLVLFDSTSSESFAYMKRIVDVISPVAGFRVIMIVATKVDLLSDRVVTQDEASDYARSLGFLYAETSAKTGEGVDNAFKTCITVALEKESSEEAPKTDVITLQENPPSVANQDCQC